MEKQEVLILGGCNLGLGRAIAARIKELDQVMVIDKPSDVFEIKIPEDYGKPINIELINHHQEHGWYRKFEKNGKKRNFKKAI